MAQSVLLVNFGGPRSLEEVEPFLCELLTDRELIRQKGPAFLHDFLFRRIAKKRARTVRIEYEKLGGASPIYATTERLATLLQQQINRPVFTFHRTLTATHKHALHLIEQTSQDLTVLPLFPQFSYTTTGSIAAFFSQHLSSQRLRSLRWIKSYPTDPAFLYAHEHIMRAFLAQHRLEEEKSFFLFSAHGIPQSFVEEGDPYPYECQQTAHALLHQFPRASGLLSYQSQFGPEEWTRPYTKEVCQEIRHWCPDRSTIIIIPLSFTSDHLETLFEIEQLYLPLIIQQGLTALRCPALNLHPTWITALVQLLKRGCLCTNKMLTRK
jgi:protoporphyrin/coproporphyrin ferrochelatase